MPTVTLDRRGLSVGGERRWIVSGTVDPASVPHELWRDRLAAAAAAGLNTVLVPVVWAAHEPRRGAFDFEGDRDIAAFVRLAGELGLSVILRPGPFQGDGRDRGGLPAWVDGGRDDAGRPLPTRSASPGFLSACSAWFRALAGELKGLQASEGGPIALVQNEHRWFCADPEHARAYLGELQRFLRESGFVVPIVSANNLYASAEGETEGWNGHTDLLATFRQLRTVRPDQACLALDFELGSPSVWGEAESPTAPARVLHELSQAMAAGAQVNIAPFAGGSRFGFCGGRLPFARDGYVAQSAAGGAPLDEGGRPTATLDAVRPLLLFASSFERTLSGIEWRSAGGTMAPQGGCETVVHAPGENGSLLFVLRDPDAKTSRGYRRELLLSDGRTIEVDLKDSPAAWCLLDAAIGPNSRVDYTNASALWSGPRAFAVSAPAGSTVAFSINGSEGQATPSRGKSPVIVEHEGVTVVALSTQQAAACAVTDESLLIGGERAGVRRADWNKWTLLRPDGTVETGAWERASRPGVRRTLSNWSRAATDDLVSGASHRYAVIDGPATLSELGASEGYGWVRLKISSAGPRKPKTLLPESGDRAHVYAGGALVEIAGLAPGASDAPFTLPLTKGSQTLVVLLDNLGRPSGGWSDAQPSGLWGPAQEVKAFKVAKPALVSEEPLRPLAFRTPLTRVHSEETTHAQRVTWSFAHRRKSPVLFRLGALPAGVSGLLVVNDEPVEALDEGSRGDIVLRQGGALRNGKNIVQFAPLSDPGEALATLAKSVLFYECVNDLTQGAEWAFARWETPSDREFAPWDKTPAPRAPTWWRATFPPQPLDEPLAFDPKGLTKGQLYLNGHNVGRYFNATADGKSVAGQRGVYLPEPWLRQDAPNVVTLFDEHGGDPSKCRVALLHKLRG